MADYNFVSTKTGETVTIDPDAQLAAANQSYYESIFDHYMRAESEAYTAKYIAEHPNEVAAADAYIAAHPTIQQSLNEQTEYYNQRYGTNFATKAPSDGLYDVDAPENASVVEGTPRADATLNLNTYGPDAGSIKPASMKSFFIGVGILAAIALVIATR